MASIFTKRGELWLGWYEKNYEGITVHPQVNLRLKDNKQNRKIADGIKKQKEVELTNYHNPYIENISIDDAILKFMETKKYKSKSTITIYLQSLQKIKAMNKRILRDLNESDINFLIDKFKSEGKSEETIKTYLRHIKIFCEYAVKTQMLLSNPVPNYKTKSNNVVRIIRDEELQALWDFFSKRNKKHYYFLRLLNSTGLRISEAVALNWNDINYEKKTITISNSKGNRFEEIPLTEESEEIFRSIDYEAEKIFNYKSTDSLKSIKIQLQKFGFTFHDFRRTFGTRWSKELKPFELKKIMRHRDLRTTDEYYIHSELNDIKSKMDGCYLVAKSEKKSSKLYKISNPQNRIKMKKVR